MPGVAAPAGALPFPAASFAAVVSSCAVKHWPDLAEGLAECARVTCPGGRLVVVEIDGGEDPGDLGRFAARTRIPPGLRRLYPRFARAMFVPVSPRASALERAARSAGYEQVSSRRVEGLPFLVVTGSRSSGDSR